MLLRISLSKYLNLAIIIAFTSLLACKAKTDNSTPNGHYLAGDLYAYGQIILAEPTQAPEFLLKPATGVNSLDRQGQGTYTLESKTGDETAAVQYVDYIAGVQQPAIYKHVVVTRKANVGDGLDIWLHLRASSPSYKDRNTKYIYVGSSAKKPDSAGAKVQLYSRILVSRIAYGDEQGKMALHYAAESIRARPYSSSYCSVLMNLPDHLRHQIPSSFDESYCPESKPMHDICNSNPADRECYPELPAKLLSFDNKGLELDGRKMLRMADNQFRLIGDEQIGVIPLVSKGSPYPLTERDQLIFHVRTAENRQHDHCLVHVDLERSIASSAVVVVAEFSNAILYEDKVCNIVVEDIKTGTTDFIQVIKR